MYYFKFLFDCRTALCSPMCIKLELVGILHNFEHFFKRPCNNNVCSCAPLDFRPSAAPGLFSLLTNCYSLKCCFLILLTYIPIYFNKYNNNFFDNLVAVAPLNNCWKLREIIPSTALCPIYTNSEKITIQCTAILK